MITLLLHLLRLVPFLFGGRRQLALENLALRQQLVVYKGTGTRRRYAELIASSGSGWPEPGPAGDSLSSSSLRTPSAVTTASLPRVLDPTLSPPDPGSPTPQRRDRRAGQKNGRGESLGVFERSLPGRVSDRIFLPSQAWS
jgi:hypothetical protein